EADVGHGLLGALIQLGDNYRDRFLRLVPAIVLEDQWPLGVDVFALLHLDSGELGEFGLFKPIGRIGFRDLVMTGFKVPDRYTGVFMFLSDGEFFPALYELPIAVLPLIQSEPSVIQRTPLPIYFAALADGDFALRQNGLVDKYHLEVRILVTHTTPTPAPLSTVLFDLVFLRFGVQFIAFGRYYFGNPISTFAKFSQSFTAVIIHRDGCNLIPVPIVRVEVFLLPNLDLELRSTKVIAFRILLADGQSAAGGRGREEKGLNPDLIAAFVLARTLKFSAFLFTRLLVLVVAFRTSWTFRATWLLALIALFRVVANNLLLLTLSFFCPSRRGRLGKQSEHNGQDGEDGNYGPQRRAVAAHHAEKPGSRHGISLRIHVAPPDKLLKTE